MSIHALKPTGVDDPVRQAKIDLAAAHRLAVLHELEEGIDNHFTVTVPGYDDRYLILPFGFHWSEAKASDIRHKITARSAEPLKPLFVKTRYSQLGAPAARRVRALRFISFYRDHHCSVINTGSDKQGQTVSARPN